MMKFELLNGLEYVHSGGCFRVLACLPPDARPLRRTFTPFRQVAPVLPASQWQELNRRDLFGADWRLDQKDHGSCTGFSAAGALMKSRGLNGSAFVKLSGSYPYSFVNGGHDDGASIHELADVLLKEGTCPDALCPWDSIYPPQISDQAKQAAQRYKALEVYTASNFAEIMSALQLGFVPVFAIQVGDNFDSFDSNGIAGFSQGPGNHAVHADGCRKLPSGEWLLDMPNSWGLRFGQQGRCYLSQRHVESVQQDCYVLRAAADDPDEPNRPPPVHS